jgi:hypothetical protein
MAAGCTSKGFFNGLLEDGIVRHKAIGALSAFHCEA